MQLTEDKANLSADYADKFSQFLNQQQILQGQFQNMLEYSNKTSSDNLKNEKRDEKKGLFERLFGKK